MDLLSKLVSKEEHAYNQITLGIWSLVDYPIHLIPGSILYYKN